ncbi:trypsin-like peptidase domain-containing protein [Shewanella sp. VB17]|uniref:S1 family peptidase n=1 Tax=Shewanella sp. VB17 TaxID=2739432 RepID=UPI0015652152|nr:serine protease [Shewanella sp. VB17]NRD73187.1 trypsin-like peptidase domain-containing protein [Shewanella sp. VB17]
MKNKKIWLAVLFLPISFGWADNSGTEVPESGGNEFYSSIGKLNGALTCTVSFVQFSHNLNAKASFITNGHCVQQAFNSAAGNNVIVNENVNFTAKFNYFKDTIISENVIDIAVNKVVYSTMKGVDVAVVSANETVADLIEKGLTPYYISTDALAVDTPIIIAGVPQDVNALQLSFCQSEKSYDVVEGVWHWYGFAENDCQGISAGSSGSPAFDDNNRIVGMINTTTTTAVGKTCYSGNPCVNDAKGAHVKKNKNYLVPLHNLALCFDDDGQFLDDNDGCPLPPPSNVAIANYPYIFSGLNSDNTFWDINVENNESNIRYKKILLSDNSQSCQNIDGYSVPLGASDAHFSEMMIPTSVEGVHQICIISEFDDAMSPSVVQVIVDNMPPLTKPDLYITPRGFEPLFSVPEYVDFWIASGSPESLSCDSADYKQYNRIPTTIDETPLKICLYGFDAAHNQSQKFQYLIR